MNLKKYIMEVEKVNAENENSGKGVDKIGGLPTHLPPQDRKIYGYYLMQIYNNERISGRQDVLCWQFYQDEFGGPITDVVEVPVGAKLYEGEQIKKRRWIDEYIIKYYEIEDNQDSDEEEFLSSIGGTPDEYTLEECKDMDMEYVGIIYEDLCPYGDLSFGMQCIILAKDKNGSLCAI